MNLKKHSARSPELWWRSCMWKLSLARAPVCLPFTARSWCSGS
ncbi:hypothetical protein GGD66_002159 [Bradyrhizobium sp. CIR48]|nr:hypothetical protein [Bradyrhizobium sp. CIR48]